MRCPSGSGWGEALVTDPASRKSAADPAPRASRTRGGPDGRRWRARALRPLARETSAGGARRVGVGPPRGLPSSDASMSGSQGSGRRQASRATTRIRWSAWRMASTPSGGLLPAQRKLGALRRRARSGGRSILWLCSWIEAGCRSRREAPGPSQPPWRVTAAESVGSSLPASCSVWRRGVRSRLAAVKPGARWRAVDDPAGGVSRPRRGESTRRGKASWCRRSSRL
jgi:hypothetical protein